MLGHPLWEGGLNWGIGSGVGGLGSGVGEWEGGDIESGRESGRKGEERSKGDGKSVIWKFRAGLRVGRLRFWQFAVRTAWVGEWSGSHLGEFDMYGR